MRTLRPTSLLAVLALATGAAASAGTLPSVRVLDLSPVTVRGAHFAAGEQVKVTLHAGAATRVRTIRAATGGGFTVGFGTLQEKDRCSGSIAVTAVGARGHHALYKLPGMACPAMASGTTR